MSDREIKQFLRQRFFSDPEEIGLEASDESTVRAKLDEYFTELVPMGITLTDEHRDRLADELSDDILGFGPIEELMRDPAVTEIMINGPDRIYVEWQGKKALSQVTFDDEQHLRHTVEKLVMQAGKRLDEARPHVDLSLEDGSRVNVIIPPAVEGGPHVTIRRYQHNFQSLEDLVQAGTLDERLARFLLACIRGRLNILFSGASGAGKTTLVEVLSRYIDNSDRIVVIEDTPELLLQQNNMVRLLTRPANADGEGEVTAQDLFSNSLRMRPDRIILGELRGGEALAYLQALNSGHRGSLGVIHASRPEEALVRLENLVPFAGMPIPLEVTRQQIAHGVDVVVHLAQLADGSRKVTRIAEVLETPGEAGVQVLDLFLFREQRLDVEGKVSGRFEACGSVPGFYPRFELAGIPLRRDLFAPPMKENDS